MFDRIRKFILAKVFKKHYWRTGKCKGCGQCCTHIYVKHFKHVLKDEDEFKKLQYLHKFYSDLEIIGKDDLGLIFECKNLNGKESKWRVRVVKPKEKYGREYSLVNNSKSSLVEFYDMTKNIEKFPLGQYVASYNYETLRDSNKGGLHLNGDSSSWYIETNEYNKILEWLNSLNL